MSITGYTLKIKELCDTLRSINVIIDEDEMVQICLDSLAPRFGTIRLAILARENLRSFFDLQSISFVEENHVRQRNNASNGLMLYSQKDEGRGFGHGNRGRFSRDQQDQSTREHNISYQQDVLNVPDEELGRRGS